MPDFGAVFTEARNAADRALKARGKEARAFLRTVAATQRRSIESLLRAFAAGEIDRATLAHELDDHKRAMRAELLALKAVGKQAAPGATNAFFASIRGALPARIGGRT